MEVQRVWSLCKETRACLCNVDPFVTMRSGLRSVIIPLLPQYLNRFRFSVYCKLPRSLWPKRLFFKVNLLSLVFGDDCRLR